VAPEIVNHYNVQTGLRRVCQHRPADLGSVGSAVEKIVGEASKNLPRGKNYRPRASDRTMVDKFQPTQLVLLQNRKRRHEDRMDLRRAITPRASQQDMGWRAQRTTLLLPVAGEVFLLTLPFIETRLP